MPYSHSDEEMKKWVMIDLKKDEMLDETLMYFFKFLSNTEINYGTKFEKANVFLKKQLALSNKGEKVIFVILLVFFS